MGAETKTGQQGKEKQNLTHEFIDFLSKHYPSINGDPESLSCLQAFFDNPSNKWEISRDPYSGEFILSIDTKKNYPGRTVIVYDNILFIDPDFDHSAPTRSSFEHYLQNTHSFEASRARRNSYHLILPDLVNIQVTKGNISITPKDSDTNGAEKLALTLDDLKD